MFYMGVYVDDIILAGKSESMMKKVKADISRKFDTKDLGKLSYFLGTKVLQSEENESIWIGQCAYTENLSLSLEEIRNGRLQVCDYSSGCACSKQIIER